VDKEKADNIDRKPIRDIGIGGGWNWSLRLNCQSRFFSGVELASKPTWKSLNWTGISNLGSNLGFALSGDP